MLAERARLTLSIVLLSAATVATTVAVMRGPCEQQAASIVVSTTPVDGAIEITDNCPAYARTAMHLGADATLYCVRGQFPEPGTFVFAQYRTTETWERFAVVADDGRLIVPMLDRPRR